MKTKTVPPRTRIYVEAACARMAPDPDRLAAAIEQFTRHAGTDSYWQLVIDTLTVAFNTVHHYHAAECRKTICATCSAIRFATTVVSAHQISTGWAP